MQKKLKKQANVKDKMQNKVKKAKIKKDKNGKNFSHSLVDNAVFGYRV